MSKRKLTPEEMALWRSVADKTERLLPEKPKEPVLPEKTFVPVVKQPLPPFRRPTKPQKTAVTLDLADQLTSRLAAAPVRMDQKAFKRMKRGKMAPEGRIDLHGMTLDRAHPALTRFILGAAGSGKRLVLVITGKGRDRDDGDPIPTRKGVLRHQLPHWLTTPPLVHHVIQFTPAHISHGGEGAFYVYLKRQR